MKASQFDAKTFGAGELITQRKLFRVPKHQRSYSWSREAVSSFLEDIDKAFESNASEYFIGLIVIQGPEDGEWILLDGQQRLTTTTMMFSSIRNWLIENGFTEDAKQVESEFLGVRRLGGDYSSRMLLNEENQSVFTSLVITKTPLKDLEKNIKAFPKKSSNRYLIESALECQHWVNQIVNSVAGSNEEKARALFRLAAFLETRIKVVCVEVSNDIDAYVLFESLNDRGVELSALDLIKNYIYSKAITNENADEVHRQWLDIVEKLDERNPDDFLKMFWTSRYGVVQKTQLFRKIREKYQTKTAVEALLQALQDDADILSSLEDDEHTVWNSYPRKIREYLSVINLLGSKQVKPVLLAAIHTKDQELLENVMWGLIVVVIRFQIIGRGRTGVMEKTLGKFCEGISSRKIKTSSDVNHALAELNINDTEFIESFASHKESKLARVAYFLHAIETNLVAHSKQKNLVNNFIFFSKNSLLYQIIDNDSKDLLGNEQLTSSTIGNFMLINEETLNSIREEVLQQQFEFLSPLEEAKRKTNFLKKIISNSNFETTKTAIRITESTNVGDAIRQRSRYFAEKSAIVWSLS